MLRITFALLTAICCLTGICGDNPKSSPKDADATLEVTASSSDLVVVNKKMIDKFNKANYSISYLSLNELLSKCDFNEIKQIAEAYVSDDLNIRDGNQIAEVIDRKVKEPIPQRESLLLYSELIE